MFLKPGRCYNESFNEAIPQIVNILSEFLFSSLYALKNIPIKAHVPFIIYFC